MKLIVYHIFCVGDYIDVVNRQISRLISSGLYDWADVIEVSCVDPQDNYFGIDEVFENLNKVNLLKTDRNHYEWWGINKIWELSQNNEGQVLYFHTKGVSNKYLKKDENEISELKINGIKWWVESLEYFLIDNWTDCVNALDTNDNCGVTCINGWWWGNFWWSNLSWVKNNPKPAQGDRWYFENWLNHARQPKIKEFHHFTFNPYFSILPDDIYRTNNWFKDKEIDILSAEYGTLGIQQDEGQPYVDKITVDVTQQVINNFLSNDKKSLFISANNELNGDPIFGHRKFLLLRLKVDDQILQFCINEGMNLNLKFDE